MSGHTPGPWHWVNSKTDEPFDFDDPWDGEGCPSLRTVAEFPAGSRFPTRRLPKWVLDAEPLQYGNDEANARLIAAAPELLEALEHMLAEAVFLSDEYLSAFKHWGKDATIQGWDKARWLRASEAAKNARAAIAKATGNT